MNVSLCLLLPTLNWRISLLMKPWRLNQLHSFYLDRFDKMHLNEGRIYYFCSRCACCSQLVLVSHIDPLPELTVIVHTCYASPDVSFI